MTEIEEVRTTHIGSLPRPQKLLEALDQIQEGEEYDEDRFREIVGEATRSIVQRQSDIGIDIANNGEQPRIAFNFYAANRLSGFDGESTAPFWADLEEFPSYAEKAFDTVDIDLRTRPAATAPIDYEGKQAAINEIKGFHQALEGVDGDFENTFFTAASPGVVATSLGNEYYNSYEEYLFDIADAMAEEYQLIAENTNGY
ncbi:MAG: methionine synthase, partial [Halobacteriaceae archaeon]